MAHQSDTSKGWCCDGRTWAEHAKEGGECCQPQGKRIHELPGDGQRKAQERLAQVRGSTQPQRPRFSGGDANQLRLHARENAGRAQTKLEAGVRRAKTSV